MLTDLECIIASACLILVMHVLDNLIKFSKACNCFIGDIVAVVKTRQRDVYSQYVDPMCAFTQDCVLRCFKDIVWNTLKHVVTMWMPYVNNTDDNLSIRVIGSIIMMKVKLQGYDEYQMITPSLLMATSSLVQHQCCQI